LARQLRAILLPLILSTVACADGPTATRFEISMAPGLLDGLTDGRLLVVLGRSDRPEPRRTIGQTGLNASPILGRDVDRFAPGRVGVVDGSAAAFPIADLDHLTPGEYWVQAVFDHNRDLKLPNAPGNLYSKPRRVRIDPARDEAIALELTETVVERPPAETDRLKFLTVRSERLTAFHGRPISLRAGVRLPAGFDRDPDRRYPLRVHIGGYGSRYWHFPRDEDDAPPMILLVLDGAGPLGDPYQVNSANHGPYGDAVVRELIPLVERQYRALGEPRARVLDGGSTGGWVALALQVFYPDDFNGAWASCPDPVDFRAFQLVNIYEDTNAYVNKYGFERPGARDLDGDVKETMRHQCRMENVLGRGDSWAMSGQQWGAWNAAFGPRGPDGRPVPLWDPKTGALDRTVAQHWRRYDLRRVLEENWPDLGPKLRGKLHIRVGDADDYFLDNAVRRLEAFLKRADPPFEGTIAYGPRQGHCWSGLSQGAMLGQMADAVGRGGR
jgi:hypothetical protein